MNLDERLQKDLSPDIYCLVHNKIVNLEQQVKKQKVVINKAIDLLNAYIGVLDDTSDLYFENVKSILELEVKEVSK